MVTAWCLLNILLGKQPGHQPITASTLRCLTNLKSMRRWPHQTDTPRIPQSSPSMSASHYSSNSMVRCWTLPNPSCGPIHHMWGAPCCLCLVGWRLTGTTTNSHLLPTSTNGATTEPASVRCLPPCSGLFVSSSNDVWLRGCRRSRYYVWRKDDDAHSLLCKQQVMKGSQH